MGYKLIALDVDGTIRSNEHPLSERTRRAIRSVREAGARVTIATGRSYRSGASAAADLDLTAPIVTFQGAHIADPKTGEILWQSPLTDAMTADAISALSCRANRDDLELLGYFEDDVFVMEMSEWARAYGERTGVRVRKVDAEGFTSNPMTRLVVRGADDDIERLELDLKGRFNGRLYITRSLPYFCEILHPDGGKEKALQWLCGHLGIREERTVSFGNGYNDVEMLRWAGLSVAVDGAVPEAVEAADFVAPSMEEDGVARTLEDLLDRGLIG